MPSTMLMSSSLFFFLSDQISLDHQCPLQSDLILVAFWNTNQPSPIVTREPRKFSLLHFETCTRTTDFCTTAAKLISFARNEENKGEDLCFPSISLLLGGTFHAKQHCFPPLSSGFDENCQFVAFCSAPLTPISRCLYTDSLKRQRIL